MFCWVSDGPLRPMRMVRDEPNHHEPKYEVVKYERPEIRRWTLNVRRYNKVERDREMRQRLPGKTGTWPRNIKQRKKR